MDLKIYKSKVIEKRLEWFLFQNVKKIKNITIELLWN